VSADFVERLIPLNVTLQSLLLHALCGGIVITSIHVTSLTGQMSCCICRNLRYVCNELYKTNINTFKYVTLQTLLLHALCGGIVTSIHVTSLTGQMSCCICHNLRYVCNELY